MKRIGFVAVTLLALTACGPTPASVTCIANQGESNERVFYEKSIPNGVITFDDGNLSINEYGGAVTQKTIPSNVSCDITSAPALSDD